MKIIIYTESGEITEVYSADPQHLPAYQAHHERVLSLGDEVDVGEKTHYVQIYDGAVLPRQKMALVVAGTTVRGIPPNSTVRIVDWSSDSESADLVFEGCGPEETFEFDVPGRYEIHVTNTPLWRDARIELDA